MSPKDMLRVAGDTTICRCAPRPTRRACPAARKSRSWRCSKASTPPRDHAASVGLFDEKNTLKKQWTAQKEDLAKRPVMAASDGAARHLSPARRRRRRAGRAGTTDYDLRRRISPARIRSR